MTTPEKNDNLDRLLRAYIAIRDRRSVIKREYEETDGGLRHKLGLIEAQLMKMLAASGSDALKVGGLGQAYLSKKVHVKATDWDALWTHILQEGAVDLLQKRVASRAVQEYLESEGELPPGVDMSTERVVNVRRD